MFPYTEEGVAAKENKKYDKQHVGKQDEEEVADDVYERAPTVRSDGHYQYTLRGMCILCLIEFQFINNYGDSNTISLFVRIQILSHKLS